MSAANHSRINEAIEETYLGPSRYKRAVFTLKMMAASVLFGAGGMYYEIYTYEHGQTESIREIVLGGWCGQKDPKVKHQINWYNCQDAYIVGQLQKHDVEHDMGLANRGGDDTDAILADMAKKKPAKRKPAP